MPSSRAATVTSLEPWPSAMSIFRPRAQRSSAVERDSRPTPLAASRPPRCRPIASQASPCRSHRSSVCAKSRAVTSTSAPRCSSARTIGRMTSTCGELVRSTQTRIADRGDDLARLLGRQDGAHGDRQVGAGGLVGAGQRAVVRVLAHRRLQVGGHAVVGLVADAGRLQRGRQLVGRGRGGSRTGARRGRRAAAGGRRARRAPLPRSGRPRRGGRRPSPPGAGAARAGSPPAGRRAASCGPRARTSACRASRGTAASARARRSRRRL